jgi:hypothetical protein
MIRRFRLATRWPAGRPLKIRRRLKDSNETAHVMQICTRPFRQEEAQLIPYGTQELPIFVCSYAHISG